MNVAVVTRTTAGLAAWLRGRGSGHARRDGRRGRARRPARLGGVRRRRRRGARRAGFAVRVLPAPLPTPVLGLRGARARRGGRRADHRVAQPAGGQRVQGLPRRRRPARAPGRRGDRGGHRGGPARGRRADAAAPCPRWTTTCSSPTWTASRGAAPRHRADAAGGAHPAARRRRRRGGARAAPGRVHRRARRQRAGRARPRLPDGRVPQPGGAGRDRRRCSRSPPTSDADLAVALDPDADRCALGVPAPGRLADADRRRDRRAAG